jgi:DNA-binding NarL/FixJ family response regulator
MPPVGVMAVDHREFARRAGRELVARTPGFTWVAEAASAEEALEAAIQLRPDLVLVESDMPGIDGAETSRRLKEALPKTVVVVLGANGNVALDTLTPEGLHALWKQLSPGLGDR